METWGEDVIARMNAVPMPDNMAEAEAALMDHR